MPNHVHLIVVPQSADALRRALGEAHRRYTRRINFREGWRGHLWQGRFASFAMDERYLLRAARYVELNPVRAKLCRVPWRWRWSSAAAHLTGQEDGVAQVAPLLERVKDWREYLLGDFRGQFTYFGRELSMLSPGLLICLVTLHSDTPSLLRTERCFPHTSTPRPQTCAQGRFRGVDDTHVPAAGPVSQ